jgi:uncharacterized membrane protein YhfC
MEAESAFTIPATNLAFQLASIVVMVVAPFAAAAVARRRLGVGWRVFWLGALVFVVSQMLLRIPLVSVLQAVLAPRLAGSAGLAIAIGTVLALTAALFETIGRYLGYRFLLRGDPKTWEVGVMFGLGHGGIESAVLVAGLALVQLVTLLTMTEASLAALPAAQAEALRALAAAVSAGPAWLGLVGGWERIVAITFHVAMSVIVLQVFARGEARWLWYALGAHFLLDFLAPVLIPSLLPAGVTRILIQQAVLLIFGALSLWVILALRPHPSSASRLAQPSQETA